MNVIAVPRILTFLLCFTCSLHARIWTDTDGKIVEAELVTADATTVTLRLTNFKTKVVSLETLSGVDTLYVQAWLKKHPPKPAAKPVTPVTPVTPVKPLTPDGPAPTPVKPLTPLTPGPSTIGMNDKPTGPVGFDGQWPDSAFVPEELNIEVIKEDDPSKTYVYHSTHFEFTSNVQLRPRLISTCAKVFEATHEFLRLLPLNHRSTAGGKKLFPVVLFETYEQYVKAGGPSGSAGVCIERGDGKKVLVPLKSLGVRKVGKDFTVDPGDKDYHVLSHEITHMIMERSVMQASWYIEGSAEYVANTPYTGGRFKVAVNKASIVMAVTAYGKDGNGGAALGKELKMPSLERFMTQSYNEFLSNSRFNYGMGCLLTYYWYHQDGNGDAARIKAYVKDLQAGVPENKAQAKLLDGRSWEEMQKDFAKGMKRVGVKVDYKA
jgi:hypothetical protein